MSRRGTWSALLAAVLLTAVALGAGTVLRDPPGSAPATRPVAARSTPAPVSASDPAVDPAPARVLRAWDRQRARAWAAGDPASLRALYAAGSVAGRRDVAMLRQWRSRGLVVQGLRTEVLALRVLERSADRMVLEVTDRVRGGRAVALRGEDGVRRPLPRDLPTRRRVSLRAVAGEWRVSSVRPSGPASR